MFWCVWPSRNYGNYTSGICTFLILEGFVSKNFKSIGGSETASFWFVCLKLYTKSDFRGSAIRLRFLTVFCYYSSFGLGSSSHLSECHDTKSTKTRVYKNILLHFELNPTLPRSSKNLKNTSQNVHNLRSLFYLISIAPTRHGAEFRIFYSSKTFSPSPKPVDGNT